ncbi:hypothetical protein PSN_5269 [Pseudomonas sp. NGC7]
MRFVYWVPWIKQFCIQNATAWRNLGPLRGPFATQGRSYTGNAIPCRSGLVSRKGCEAAPAFNQTSR